MQTTFLSLTFTFASQQDSVNTRHPQPSDPRLAKGTNINCQKQKQRFAFVFVFVFVLCVPVWFLCSELFHFPFPFLRRRLRRRERETGTMSSAEAGAMEPLTSGASHRIIPVMKALRASLIFVYTFFLSFFLFILPRRRRLSLQGSMAAPPSSPRKQLKRMWLVREEEDTSRRRALAEDVGMGSDDWRCRWSTSIFYGVRNNALFCRQWFPVTTGDLK